MIYGILAIFGILLAVSSIGRMNASFSVVDSYNNELVSVEPLSHNNFEVFITMLNENGEDISGEDDILNFNLQMVSITRPVNEAEQQEVKTLTMQRCSSRLDALGSLVSEMEKSKYDLAKAWCIVDDGEFELSGTMFTDTEKYAQLNINQCDADPCQDFATAIANA